VSELIYNASNADEAALHGITIHSVNVLPSVCRIEASIDFTKNSLADPNNVNVAESPQLLGKLDWLSTHVHAVAGSSEYGGMTTPSFLYVHLRQVKCLYTASLFAL